MLVQEADLTPELHAYNMDLALAEVERNQERSEPVPPRPLEVDLDDHPHASTDNKFALAFDITVHTGVHVELKM